MFKGGEICFKFLPGSQCRQGAIGDVAGWMPEISAHINSSQDTGDCWKEHTEHGKPVIPILVIRERVVPQILPQPAVETGICEHRQRYSLN